MSLWEKVYIYVTTVFKRFWNLFLRKWEKFCYKFKIFKFKSFKNHEKMIKYLNNKNFYYKYHHEYQKTQHGEGNTFFFIVKDRKFGSGFHSRAVLCPYFLDRLHKDSVRSYLTYIINRKYKQKLKQETKGVPRTTVFYVNKLKTLAGEFNVSLQKHNGGFKVIEWEQK